MCYTKRVNECLSSMLTYILSNHLILRQKQSKLWYLTLTVYEHLHRVTSLPRTEVVMNIFNSTKQKAGTVISYLASK